MSSQQLLKLKAGAQKPKSKKILAMQQRLENLAEQFEGKDRSRRVSGRSLLTNGKKHQRTMR